MIFPEMAKVLAPAQRGTATIRHYIVSDHESAMSGFRPGQFCPPGTYANLLVNGQLVMSDTRMEQVTNYEVARRSHGSVLIAGLGLGMILHPILAKPEVEQVTVVEINPDVIALVHPSLLSTKLTIICADIRVWKPPKGTLFDTIYFDIWPDLCTDNLKEIARLHQRFKYHLNRSGNPWMGSWGSDWLKQRRRRGE